jgi:hypothetical protein
MPQPQCTAHAKRSGVRCLLPARPGYPVCRVHGAGKGAKRGGRPIVHGAYSKFLTAAEAEDFAQFKASFSLDDDLAFAATKALHASGKVEAHQLPALLELPSKLFERRKRVLEGITLKIDVDTVFLRGFVAKVMEHVKDPTAQADLLAYLEQHLGEAAQG